MLNATDTTKKRTALGQGLDALIPFDDTDVGDRNRVKEIPIDSLEPNPFQPRRLFDEELLTDLANSIREKGVIQPLIVRPTLRGTYEIVAGERRWRAASIAGFESVPAIVREMSDSESLEIALIENLQRENLNAVDTAEAYDTLIKRFDYTHESLAKKIGKDRSSITNHLRLLRLPDAVKEDLRQERLSTGHAKALLAVEDVQSQLSLSRKVISRKLSVRELEKIVQNVKNKPNRQDFGDRQLDPELREVENGLSGHLGTKVRIKISETGSGKLEIHIHSMEVLNGIVELLGYRENIS